MKEEKFFSGGVCFISRLEQGFRDFYLWKQVNVHSVGVEINPYRCQTYSNRKDAPLSMTIQQDSQVSGKKLSADMKGNFSYLL